MKRVSFVLVLVLSFSLISPIAFAKFYRRTWTPTPTPVKEYDYQNYTYTESTPRPLNELDERFVYYPHSTPTPTPSPTPVQKKSSYWNYGYKKYYNPNKKRFNTPLVMGGTATAASLGTMSSTPLGWGLVIAGGLSYVGYNVYNWANSEEGKENNPGVDCSALRAEYYRALEEFEAAKTMLGRGHKYWDDRYAELLMRVRELRERIQKYC